MTENIKYRPMNMVIYSTILHRRYWQYGTKLTQLDVLNCDDVIRLMLDNGRKRGVPIGQPYLEVSDCFSLRRTGYVV